MKNLGAFMSMSGSRQLGSTARYMKELGGDCMMIYTGSPKSFVRSYISPTEVEAGWKVMKEVGMEQLIIHAPYIMNPANPDVNKQERAIRTLSSELERTKAYGSELLVVHPGSHMGAGVEAGINNVAYVINQVLDEQDEDCPTICIETMAGKGREIGFSFRQLACIIAQIHRKDKVGVCFDTCHVHDSGYDISTNLDGVLNQFDQVVGLDKIKVIHVNGSKNELGAMKDRHANLLAEDNHIALEALRTLCQMPIFETVPKILETPDEEGCHQYREELAFLKL